MAATAPKLEHWYALAVVAGREPSIRTRILDRLERANLKTPDLEIICPDEEVVLDKGTPERRLERRLTLPGYVLLRCRKLNGPTVVNIKRVAGVMSFLGGDEKPTPLPWSEVEKLLGNANTGGSGLQKRREVLPTWEVGTTVTITEGPLSDFTGEISSVDPGKQTVQLEIEIFGRRTPAEVNFRALRRA